MLSVPAFVVSWKFGIAWLVFVTLVFIAAEELLLRGVDVATAEVRVIAILAHSVAVSGLFALQATVILKLQ